MSRVTLTVIVAFWLVMNCLLWRSQWGPHSLIGSAIPVEVVWSKMLTAPDNSSLEIYDHDKRVGLCRWAVSPGRPLSVENKSLSEDYAPDEELPQITGYNLTVEGNTALIGTNRISFEVVLHLSTNETWQDFHFTLRLRPTVIDIRALAGPQKITFKVGNLADTLWQKTLSFSDLDHPDSLLDEVAGTYDATPVAATGLSLSPASIIQLAQGVHWEAHEDWMQIGHSRVRVFRLETVLFGKQVFLFISRAGEILWAEGPNKITVRNEAFSHL